MTRQVLGFTVLFGIGAFLVAVGQPLGRPRAPLSERLRRLHPDAEPEAPSARPFLFRTRGLDLTLGPLLESAGGALMRLRTAVGFAPRGTGERLAAAGSPMTAAQFLGQKVAGAVVGFALLPVAQGVGLLRSGGGAVWLWLLLAAAGYFGPDVWLVRRTEARRRQIGWELGSLLDVVTLSVSAGMGIEQALQEAVLGGEGPIASELRAGLREARLTGRPVWQRLEDFGERAMVPELAMTGAAIGAAVKQGTPILQALRTQAESVRDRRRLELLEAGERAAVRMLLPVGGFILPAFFIAVLFPAAIQILGLSQG